MKQEISIALAIGGRDSEIAPTEDAQSIAVLQTELCKSWSFIC